MHHQIAHVFTSESIYRLIYNRCKSVKGTCTSRQLVPTNKLMACKVFSAQMIMLSSMQRNPVLSIVTDSIIRQLIILFH